MSFQAVAAQYAQLLTATESFAAVTLEDVVDSAFAHGGDTEQRFRQRYLW